MSDLFDDPLTFPSPSEPERSKLERQFWEFHQKNPEVYATLVATARVWRRWQPNRKLAINALFERVRWDWAIQTTDSQFKLNNNHRPYYARLIMTNEADLEGIFQIRQQVIQASIGPDNATLPSGVHVA